MVSDSGCGALSVPEQGIIDCHSHCFTGLQYAQDVIEGVAALRRAGIRNMAVLGLVNTHLNSKDMWGLIPDYVENRGNALFNEADDLLELTRLTGQTLIPFVDTRHLWGDVATELQGYIDRGFKGIKGIYLADAENDIGVRGVPDTFGITLDEYHRREWEIFSFAQDHDLPLLYHMDARRHSTVMKALLEDFPRVRVTFAHLGISRKSFSPILDNHPHVFTDISGLLAHMRGNPASYREFILKYADQVCFGSDTVLYQTAVVLEYVETVRQLRLPKDVEERIFFSNSARFLGKALPVTISDSV